MGHMEPIDLAWSLDRRAQLEKWPFRCDDGRAFERHELNELRDIWCSLANGRAAPSRGDFDARTLKPFLRNITILERVRIDPTTWRYRVRLAGSTIAEIVGDHTGKFLEEYLPAEVIPRWTAAYDAGIASPRPLRLVAEFILPRMNYLCGEALLAPLADQGGAVSMIIGCIYFKPKRAD